MATLNIDIKKATKKIYDEIYKTGDDSLARRRAEQLKNYHPQLFPIIEAWLAGEEKEFEFQGITLSYIMEKERCSFISSLASMSVLLKYPEDVDFYKRRVFGRR